MASRKISIGIPTHAEGKMLERCLDSVMGRVEEMDFQEKDVKILLSLSGVSYLDSKTVETLKAAENIEKKYGELIDIGHSERGKVNAVNDIFRRSQAFGDYLIMIDSDVTFEDDSFHELISPIVSNECVLTRGKSTFYNRTLLSECLEEKLKRRNVLSNESSCMSHRLVSGPLYAVDLNSLGHAFDKFGFVRENSPYIPTNVICEDQFVGEIMGRNFDYDKMRKCSKAVYRHSAFNIENGDLMSYWIRGIKGGIQLNRLGFRNAVYSGPDMNGFNPDKSVEVYDFNGELIDSLEVNDSAESVQRIDPNFISPEDKLRFHKNLQYRAKELLDKDSSPEYWKPLNKN